MNAPALKRFFAPSSFALVGASENPSKFGSRVLRRVVDFGFSGKLYPVNPRAKEVMGLPSYASVRELPEAPDHVGIAVPAGHVPGVLEDCAARGARFATVFTSGFAESGTDEGRALQARIAGFARASGMRIMGPNCNGLANFVDGFAMTTSATVAGPRRPAGRIGIVSQSGGAGQVNVMWRAQEAGLGVSYEVSFGNSVDLDACDFARFMVEDDASDVILMLIEHVPDGAKLREVAALAAAREKPVVVLKLGRTEAGSRAAASHTGAVTGANAVHDAAFRQFGLIRVEDCNELYETAMLLGTRRWPRGNRVAATTVSGGNAVLLVDLGAAAGLEWPAYSDVTQARLGEWLPKLSSTANPTDLTNAAIGRKEILSRLIGIITADDSVDVMIPIQTMAARSDLLQVAAAAKTATKPVAVLWTGGCNDDPALTPQALVAEGVPVYCNTLGCVKAVRAAVRYGRFLAARAGAGPLTRPSGADPEAARRVLHGHRGALTERASKQMLAAYGFPVTREALARDAGEAASLARGIGGAVALKIESPDILHKTEAGAIRLDVNGDDAVRRAFTEVIEAARRHAPDARLDGVLIQEMAPVGVEMMLGVARDPVFGPVVVAGLGGIHIEVLRDVAHRVAPVDAAEARAMLRELRGYGVLEGVRGVAARDIDVLCDLIVRLSWLAHDCGDLIGELDINPLVLLEAGAGARVVDALVVTGGGEVE